MKRNSFVGLLMILAITLCSAFSYASDGPTPPEKAPPSYVIQNAVHDVVSDMLSTALVVDVPHVQAAYIPAIDNLTNSNLTAAITINEAEYSPPEKPDFKYWCSYKARDLCFYRLSGNYHNNKAISHFWRC